MSFNFFLPAKPDYSVQYTLDTVGTFSWTAPNALGTGATYTVTANLVGGGASGANGRDSSGSAGTGGGGGGDLNGTFTATVGRVYNIRVGAGGASPGSGSGTSGNAGQSSYIYDTNTTLYQLTAGGGSGGVVHNGSPVSGGVGGTCSNAGTGVITNSVTGQQGGGVADYRVPGGKGGDSYIPGPLVLGAGGKGGGSPSNGGGGGGGGGGFVGGSDGTTGGSYLSPGIGGAGGKGRVQFSFTVSGAGSAGNAPA